MVNRVRMGWDFMTFMLARSLFWVRDDQVMQWYRVYGWILKVIR
jgi:hypothetical protein